MDKKELLKLFYEQRRELEKMEVAYSIFKEKLREKKILSGSDDGLICFSVTPELSDSDRDLVEMAMQLSCDILLKKDKIVEIYQQLQKLGAFK